MNSVRMVIIKKSPPSTRHVLAFMRENNPLYFLLEKPEMEKQRAIAELCVEIGGPILSENLVRGISL